MEYKEIAPFIIIESDQGSSEFPGSRVSSSTYPGSSWTPVPSLTAELSKLIRSKRIYFSLSQARGCVPISVITGHPNLSQYSSECIISSLAKLPYLCFKDAAEGPVFSFRVTPLVEIRPKDRPKKIFHSKEFSYNNCNKLH